MPLGSIPRASKRENNKLELARISQENPNTPQAQTHQKTQSAVRFIAGQHEINNVLIASPSQNEGKITVASNLAISMALANVQTVLVDLDLGRPRVHKVWGLAQTVGITSVVVDGHDIGESATLIADLDDHLAVVPAGNLHHMQPVPSRRWCHSRRLRQPDHKRQAGTNDRRPHCEWSPHQSVWSCAGRPPARRATPTTISRKNSNAFSGAGRIDREARFYLVAVRRRLPEVRATLDFVLVDRSCA